MVARTPNISATRCQMYGQPVNAFGLQYSCYLSGITSTGASVLAPYTGAGIDFLLTDNSDPLLYLDTKYNDCHVPTDFEYVEVRKTFGKGWRQLRSSLPAIPIL